MHDSQHEFDVTAYTSQISIYLILHNVNSDCDAISEIKDIQLSSKISHTIMNCLPFSSVPVRITCIVTLIHICFKNFSLLQGSTCKVVYEMSFSRVNKNCPD